MKCMILFFLTLSAAFMAIPGMVAQEKGIWDMVKETSWRFENNWTGGVVTFYETDNGKKMAVWQMCGSGFLVVGSSLFRIEIQENELLFYAYTLMDVMRPLLVYVYYFDRESGMLHPKKGMYPLSFFSSEPWVGNKFTTIPIEELKREDYSHIDLMDF
jgi:hypothetical protein